MDGTPNEVVEDKIDLFKLPVPIHALGDGGRYFDASVVMVNNPETGKPWRDPEVPETVNLEELKAKKLSERKINALVAFLKTLTDKRYEHLLN